MIRERTVTVGQNKDSTTVPKEKTFVKVYKPRTTGPLAAYPHMSFYDLIVSQDPAIEQLKYDCFEDWVFPPIQMVSQDNQQRQVVIPVRTTRHGVIREEIDGGNETQVAPAEYTQYAYILLNPSLAPVQSFGQHPGMDIKRTNYLVCVEVGDPRTGRLDNSFIRYAMPLNWPLTRCCRLAVADFNYETKAFDYFYEVVGDDALEQKIFDAWFNTDRYFFNGVIFPKLRGYMTDF